MSNELRLAQSNYKLALVFSLSAYTCWFGELCNALFASPFVWPVPTRGYFVSLLHYTKLAQTALVIQHYGKLFLLRKTKITALKN